MQEHDEIIRQWFEAICETSGCSRDEIAAILKVKPTAVSKIRAGGRNLKSIEMLALHEALNVALPRLAPKPSRTSPDSRGLLNEDVWNVANEFVRDLERQSGELFAADVFLRQASTVYFSLLKNGQEGGASS